MSGVVGMVGRDDELAAVLGATLDPAHHGLTATFVSGEGGIGKSMVLGAALEHIAAAGWTVLHGRADVLEQRIPYAVLGRLIAPLASDRSEDVASTASALRDAVDLLGTASRAAEDASFGRVCGALTACLVALAERAPLALAIDDIDTLDEDTLAAFALVTRRLSSSRIAVLATSRTDVVAAPTHFGQLVHSLDSEGVLSVLPLSPLDGDDLAAIVAPLLGSVPDADLVAALHRRTDGNPFFAVEIAASVRDAGLVDVSGPRARLTGPLRLQRGDTVLRRLVPLEPSTRAVLDGIAVLGRAAPRDVDLLAAATALAPRRVAEVFDDLVARGLLVPNAGTYTFRHDLVRDAVYEAMGPARQQRLHHAIAGHISEDRAAGRPIDLLTLARHVSAAASPGDPAAAGVLAEAGDLTRGVAPGLAADFYRRALELAPADDPKRGRLLAGHSRAASLASRPAEAAESGRAAMTMLVPGAEWSRIASLVVSALIELGRMDDALAVADEAVAVTPDAPVVAAQRASVLWNLQRFEAALDEGRRADALPTTSPAERLLVLGPLGLLAAYTDEPRPLPMLTEEMLGLGDALPPTLELYSTAIASYALASCGYLRLALAPLTRAEALLDEVGGTAFRPQILVARVLVDWLQGRWDEALDSISQAGAELRGAQVAVQAAALDAIEMEIRSSRGEPLPDRGAQPDAPVPNFRDLKAWALAGHLAATGDRAAARRVLVEAGGRTDVQIAYRPMLLSRRIDVELAEGEVATARAVLADLERDAHVRANPWATALAGRARASVQGDADEAVVAAHLAMEEGLVFEAALCRLVAAELSADAADGLDEVYRTFQSLGADGLRRRAAKVLKRRGMKVPRRRAGSSGPLTDAELGIARLVQQGLRNKEIASMLHYSPRTVEVYLTKIYSKLNVSSRMELARALDERSPVSVETVDHDR